MEPRKSKVNVKAKLNNFSVWVPLNPETEKSQVFSFSFMADLTYS